MLNVDVFAHALLLHFNAPAMKTVLGCQANIAYYYRYYRYRKLRPQVRACSRIE